MNILVIDSYKDILSLLEIHCNLRYKSRVRVFTSTSWEESNQVITGHRLDLIIASSLDSKYEEISAVLQKKQPELKHIIMFSNTREPMQLKGNMKVTFVEKTRFEQLTQKIEQIVTATAVA